MWEESEVQTNFHWDAEFEIPGDVAGEKLKKRVTTIDIPSITHDKCDINIHGYTSSIPGIVRYNGEITITFFETVDWRVIKTFKTWLDMLYSVQRGSKGEIENVFGKRSSFDKCFGKVTLIPMDKSNSPKGKIKLNHCLITQLNHGAQLADGSSPDYFKPVITLDYAYA